MKFIQVALIPFLVANYSSETSIKGNSDLSALRCSEELRWHNDYPTYYKQFSKWVEELKLKSARDKGSFTEEQMLKILLSQAHPNYQVDIARKDAKFESRYQLGLKIESDELKRAVLLAEGIRTGGQNHENISRYLTVHPHDDIVRAHYIQFVALKGPNPANSLEIQRLAGSHFDALQRNKALLDQSTFVRASTLMYRYRIAAIDRLDSEIKLLGQEVSALMRRYPKNPHLGKVYIYIQAYQRHYGLPELPDIQHSAYNDFALLDSQARSNNIKSPRS